MRIPSFIVLVVLTSVVACSTGGSSSTKSSAPAPVVRDDRPQNRESGGGLWEQLQKSREEKAQRLSNQQQLEERANSERARVPAEIRNKLDKWWLDFLNSDPSWLDDRVLWRKEGAQAANLLVENLIMLMVGSYDSASGLVYKRAKAELVDWSDYSIPYLTQGVAFTKADDVVVQHCVETLGLIGAPAVPATTAAYSEAREFRGKFNLLRALALIADPSAVPFLIGVVESRDDFRLRFTAVKALGETKDKRALPVLINALTDDDISVRKFAAGYLGSFGDRSAIEPLIRAMQRAEERRSQDVIEGEIAQMCRHSLEFITKQRFSTTQQWQSWWRANKG